MKYKIKYTEVDQATNYPLDVLSGLTGLGQETIQRLISEKAFSTSHTDEGKETVNGKDFLQWCHSVDNTIEVEQDTYPTMKVNE
ncbi:hypothetical protein [Ammoniphilus resinae]|uniref:Uncharacterized protein n=1 Tax=Ammoniphilus resinae TaxID=861532 RepID=A0ABS4GWT9_9BACL|nr:hypothetical protein [Ammoniphilus resinae]MBP1934330.1 hypothetical protein [Ammoniphilus resinae]